MSNLSFSDLSTEVYEQTGLLSTDSTVQSNVTKWLNYAQNDICSRWPWPFMEGRESVTTVADYSDGTVSVATGGTTVTTADTTFPTNCGNGQYYIQFSGANDWYNINARTDASTITIDTGYAGSTNLVGGTYIIRKFYYSLSSSCDRVIDIRNWRTPLKLVYADPRTLDDLRPNPQSTNSSYGYLCWGYDSSGNLQVSPYPFPSDARLLEFRTIKRPVDGTVSIPNKYALVIAWGANVLAFGHMKQVDIAAAWNTKYEAKIEDMKKEFRMTEDNQTVLRSIDSVQRTKWIQLPENYPAIMNG